MNSRGKASAALALHRFGFGPRVRVGDDALSAIAADPRGALLADIDRPNAGLLAVDLPSSARSARAVYDFRAEEQAKHKIAQRARKEVEALSTPQAMAQPTMATLTTTAPARKPADGKEPPLPQRILQNEAAARISAAVGADVGFVERLVWFWSNHFCVSANKDIGTAGAYEREAIRPHVLGRFADMLQAVESHPAMLVYLDNVHSMGANSVDGINRGRGPNENLARECLELHTLGVHGGYSQQDVISLANVLTGWSQIEPGEPEHGGEFVFIKRLHEPGERLVLGKTYSDDGVAQGRAVLADLARHPATAQRVALKLARHFVADDPPPSLVSRLANTFESTDGSLKEVAKTLVTAEESWTARRTKLKPPAEWIVGVLRLAEAPPSRSSAVVDLRTGESEWLKIGRVLGLHAMLGQALWRPPAPNGWPDDEAAWIDGVPRRLDIANELALRLRRDIDPIELVDRSLGPLASPDTRQTIARAESRPQAFALLVMTPEFLRR